MIVVLFDIDGTLVRTGGAGKAAIEAALVEEFQVELAADGVLYSGRTDRAISKDLLRIHGVPISDDNINRLLNNYLQRLPAALTRIPGKILPGVDDLLTRLQPHPAIRLGLLTGNVRLGARHKLAHFGLWEYFHFGGFGDHYEDRDDVARAALREAEQQCGELTPDQVWVIGDTPLDVRCARAIGARSIAVATGWHSLEELHATGADYVLPDLTEPESLLALWL